MVPKFHRICSYIQIFEFAGLFITIGEQNGYSKHANSFGSCQQITDSEMAQPNDAVDGCLQRWPECKGCTVARTGLQLKVPEQVAAAFD